MNINGLSRRPKDFKLFYAYDYPNILKFTESYDKVWS